MFGFIFLAAPILISILRFAADIDFVITRTQDPGWMRSAWNLAMAPTNAQLLVISLVLFIAAVAFLYLAIQGFRLPSFTRPERVLVPVTIIHGGTHHHVSPALGSDNIGTVLQTIKTSQEPPQVPLLSTADSSPVFEVEIGTQPPPLVVNEWGVVNFDHEIIEFESMYQNGVFYAERSGFYQFALRIDFADWDQTAAAYEFRLRTSNKDYYEKFRVENLARQLPLMVSVVAEMDAADTARYEIKQNGGKPITAVKPGSYWRGHFFRER